MKKLLAALVCALLATAMLCGALAIDIQVPSLTDVLVTHRAFLTAEDDTYKEYVVLFANGNGILTQMNDECHFFKSAGYTMDMMNAIDVDGIYPGFSQMAFADVQITEEPEFFRYNVRFRKLDDAENAQAMVDAGLLIRYSDGAVFNADSIADSIISRGGQELTGLEVGTSGLSYDIN